MKSLLAIMVIIASFFIDLGESGVAHRWEMKSKEMLIDGNSAVITEKWSNVPEEDKWVSISEVIRIDGNTAEVTEKWQKVAAEDTEYKGRTVEVKQLNHKDNLKNYVKKAKKIGAKKAKFLKEN